MAIGKTIKRLLTAIFLLLLVSLVGGAFLLWIAGQQTKTHQVQDRMHAIPKNGTLVDAGDTHMFVQRLGDPHAPAMVFIHGTGSWSETWRASMTHAVSLGYQAVAFDLPPFGYSIPPASENYSKPYQARRILAALDSIGIQRATFVAHSFGAAPVMEALMQEPQRARSLVLVDAALGLDSPQTDGKDNPLQSLLRHEWLSEFISASFLTNPAITKTLLQSFISEKDKATPDWVGLYQQPLSLSESYRHVGRWLPELVSSRGQARSDQIEAYMGLPFPVTLIWGETDAITPLVQAQHLKSYLSNVRLIVIPKAGHIPQIEEPEQFRSAITQAVS